MTTPNAPAIRQLIPLDATTVRTLRLAGLLESPTAFGKSFDEEVVEPLAETEKRLAVRAGNVLLGAFVNDALVGTVGVQRESMKKMAHKAGLWGMYVVPEHRGEGIGRSLVVEALAVAAAFGGVRQVTLYVNAINTAALALYQSVGFVTYGVEPCGIQVDGVFFDEHLMVAVLGNSTDTQHAKSISDGQPALSDRRPVPGLTLAQTELAELMSAISEDQYFAGWLNGLEYELWSLLCDNRTLRDSAFSNTHPHDIRRLRQLSAATGGWIVWSGNGDPSQKYIPLDQWEARYARHIQQPQTKHSSQ